MEIVKMVVALSWLFFILRSTARYSSYVDEARASIERGVSTSTLRVGAVIQSLWMYGGISALVLWLVVGTPGLFMGVVVGLFFAALLSLAVGNAARVARSQGKAAAGK